MVHNLPPWAIIVHSGHELVSRFQFQDFAVKQRFVHQLMDPRKLGMWVN
jgi:hypothetical protein